MKLIICVSGSGGGNGGPFGVYNYLQNYYCPNEFQIVLYDTIPRDVHNNVDVIINFISKIYKSYSEIYLIGWSMGGATVVNVAHKINNILKFCTINGLVLLATQSAEIENVYKLNISLLLIHCKNDAVLSYRISERIYNKYNNNNKKLIIVDGIGHHFTRDANYFASFIYQNTMCC